MAQTKADLVQEIVARVGLNRTEANEIVNMFFSSIRKVLEKGERVKLSGFGTFIPRDKGPRPGRNPKTGYPIPIERRRVITFRGGQKLKLRVEKYAGPENKRKEKETEAA